jgi:hypothetical protein
MPSTTLTSWRLLPAALSLIALGVAGCGSDEASTSTGSTVADVESFPAPEGRTLDELGAEFDESQLVVAPSGQVFNKGENRFGFGVFTLDRKPVPDAQVALYASRPGEPAEGPYAARVDHLRPSAAFQSQSTSTDPDAATAVYSAQIDFPTDGEYRLMALIDGPDGLERTSVAPSAVVGQFPEVPRAGDKAPDVHTPTAEDVGGNLAAIDTRQPPSTMHDVDLADALGKQPVVLLFATPALCTSRVCGPVVDIAEEVKSERGDDAAFIHMEIYKENLVDEGLRPQVKAYNLPSEPWLFVIDERGRIATEIEGAFSKAELEAALDQVRAAGAA